MGEYVTHQLLKDEAVEKRLYQLSVASTASTQDTLVVLPTGLGKTVVALLAVASRLSRAGGTALILAPTKPLVDQHHRFFSDKSELPVTTLTGETRPAEREGLWREEGPRVFVATPQVVENDVLNGRASLRDVTLLIFDEAHRASGDYPYGWIAGKHARQAEEPRRLGLTASPGNSEEDVKTICGELGLETMEVRSDTSPDVKPYVQRRVVEWVEVDLPEEIEEAAEKLRDIVEDRLTEVKNAGIIPRVDRNPSRKRLLGVQKKVQGRIARENNPSGKLFRAASLVAECMKAQHAIDVLETQGPGPALRYLDRIRKEAGSSGGSKASKRLSEDLRFKKARRALEKGDIAFPKMEELEEILSSDLEEESRAIVFTNYRDTASAVVEELEELEGLNPVRFVGQSSRGGDKGLTQTEQADVIDRFQSGEFNVLVGTSVAEEGLDIPATDLVVFYEPVASAIRSVQRKGRTGRSRTGRIVVLMTRGTKDEGVYWASRRREDKMEDSMKRLAGSSELKELSTKSQSALAKFQGEGGNGADGGEDSDGREVKGREDVEAEEAEDTEESDSSEPVEEKEDVPVVYADHRERMSGILRAMDEMELDLELKQLEVGDFVIGERTVVERKSVDDFISSIVDREGRLFRQAAEMRSAYSRPVVIVEGESLYGSRNVHPNAIRGALSSLLLDFGIPVLRTRDRDETAAMIQAMARREATAGKRKPHVHSGKTSETLGEQQVRMVSAISGVGPETADALLQEFGTVRELANADEEEYAEVEGVGPEKARSIGEVFRTPYADGEDR